MKVIFKRTRLFVMAMALFTTSLSSCERQDEFVFDEPVKNLEGSWHVVKITRNGADLSPYVDLSKFRVNFNPDNSYTIENLLPFIVTKQGNYSLDDPKYPFKITFQQEGSTTPVTTALSYPVVNGKRQISLSFSPGCDKNIYQYTFERLQP